jgi:hypothetical protein
MAPVNTRKRRPNSLNKSLNHSDYIKILKYYKMRIPNSAKTVKRAAEKMVATKLCRCIKKVGTDSEPAAIGICTRSVINGKGLRRGSFKCAKKRVSLSKRAK